MKKITFMFLAEAMMFGFAIPAFAQQTLPEVTVTATNYKYLKVVGGKEVAIPVERMQRAAAAYNIKSSEYYEEDFDSYFISFYLPEGELLAAYDKNGKLLSTAEKYTNVKMPAAVSKAIVTRFPNWMITKNVYLVKYFDKTGNASKQYKVLLENGDQRLRVKLNENGDFL
ncbi:MAG: nicotinate-nucleotide adenylyltransferase [Bacteroidota bacterium]|nr:nicotinate-nucleotide adenylyltransferase [Bacteroidota bacterium]MDP4246699.1 nicotinate-nucleotide adenylyltransferase [Bacteroidota bacterium]MDP4252830.1 nicotinate-nucleotide adenylyltransferase [Bacteroidota bacterium]MDP4260601.1 nicotinate-nucleotide adenylyltransferase [Bacteroidota bacterium]